MCVCTHVRGEQAGGDTGRFPDYLLWVFLEVQSASEDLEVDTCLSASLFSSGSGKPHRSLVAAQERPRWLLLQEL